MAQLELKEAMIGNRPTSNVNEGIDIKIDVVNFGVNTKIVLQYNYNNGKRFKVFVGSRVSEISWKSEPKQ